MKRIFISLILLSTIMPLQAEIYLKQVNGYLLASDGTTCVALRNPHTPVSAQLADPEWLSAEETRIKYNYRPMEPEAIEYCKYPWRVKCNTRRSDGARPVNDIQTKRPTGNYILPEKPCGDHARPDLRDYWRKAPGYPGGMIVCTKDEASCPK